MPSLHEWLDLYAELKRLHIGRNQDYYVLYNAYHGNLWSLGGEPYQRDANGRIVLRDSRRTQHRALPLVVNYLKGVVDDYVSLLGGEPDVKVPPPGSSDEDQAFADRLERFHYGVRYASVMAMQAKAVAWWNSVMGTSIGIIWPNFEKKHVMFRFVAPYMFYGIPDLVDPFRLSKAIIAERFPRIAVRDYYPQAAQQSSSSSFLFSVRDAAASSLPYDQQSSRRDDSLEIVKCFDKNEVVTIVGGREVARATHSMGFCPVHAIPNILIPGSLAGHSDIEQAVGLTQHASFIASAYEEYVMQDIYSPIVVEGLMEGKSPEDIMPLNPNEVIPVAIGGKVYRLLPGQGSTVVGQELARSQQLIEYNTGVPQVRTEGTMRSSITTGRGIEKSQGPYFSRTQYRTEILAFFYEQMHSDAVHMQQAIFPKATFTLFGTKGRHGSPYTQKMESRELQEYGFNKILYSPSMGMSPEQRATMMLQLTQGDQPLMDWRGAIEFLGMTDHPEEMMERIERDLEKRIARQARLRQLASGQQEPAAQAASLEGGGVPSAAVTERGSPPPLAAPGAAPGAPVPGGLGEAGATEIEGINPMMPPERGEAGAIDTGLGAPRSEQVARIVRSIANLKGEVYVAEVGERIVVTCTNFRDAQKIRRAVMEIFPSGVTVRTAKKAPSGARQITGEEVAV